MIKQLVALLFALLLTLGVITDYGPAIGQGADNSAEVDKHIVETRAVLEGALDGWDVRRMAEARAGFERLVGRGGRDWLARYYVALADYRIAIYNMANPGDENDPRAQIDPYLDEAEEQLKLSVEEKPDFTDAHALLASTLGLKIGRKPIRGMWLGPRIGGIMAEAHKFGPENPRMWLIDGIGDLHTPSMFGGGEDKAREALNKSIEFYEVEEIDDPALPSWGYDEAYAWLGYLEIKAGNYEVARTHLEKSLEINPNMGWVTYQLLPALDKHALQNP